MRPFNFITFIGRKSGATIIEIGTDLLKILQVLPAGGRNGDKRSYRLHMESIAGIKEPLYQAIPKILTKLNIENRNITICLPRNTINLRFLEVPSTDKLEVDDIIGMQAAKQTPYSRDEVVISHAITGSRQEGYSDVVLSFCQRKFIDERLDILQRAGLRADRIVISSEGVLNWYIKYQRESMLEVSQKSFVIVDGDPTSSDVVFCNNGLFAFSRSILTGRAEEIADPEERLLKFSHKLQRAIELTVEEIKLDQPQKVVLIGSIERDSNLREDIENVLQIPVELVTPSLGSELAGGLPEIEGSFSALLGFSGSDPKPLFDMTPENVRLKIALEARGKELLKTGGLVIALIASFFMLIGGSFYKEGVYLSELAKQIEKTSAVAVEIEKKADMLKFIKHRTDADMSVLRSLKEIASILPQTLYFESVYYTDNDKLILKGYAGQMSEVFNYVKALEDLKIFNGVKSEQVSKKKIDDKVMSEFEIICNL